MIFVVGRKVNILSKVKGGEKREKLRGEVIRRIIKMYVKSPVIMNSRGVVAAKERNELKSSRKTELGLETGDDEGGR